MFIGKMMMNQYNPVNLTNIYRCSMFRLYQNESPLPILDTLQTKILAG